MKRRCWHPSDDFLDPLVDAFRPLVEKDCGITEAELKAALALYRADALLVGVNWLEFNVSPDYADRFKMRIERALDEIMLIWTEVSALFACDAITTLGWAVPRGKVLPDAPRDLAVLAGEWGAARATITNTYLYLIQVSGYMRQHVKCGKVPQGRRFIPTDLQVDILGALAGKSMTADELEAAVSVSRSTLYGGKTKEGGLRELLQLEFVKNDRKVGGYYRPDAPPKIELKSN